MSHHFYFAHQICCQISFGHFQCSSLTTKSEARWDRCIGNKTPQSFQHGKKDYNEHAKWTSFNSRIITRCTITQTVIQTAAVSVSQATHIPCYSVRPTASIRSIYWRTYVLEVGRYCLYQYPWSQISAITISFTAALWPTRIFHYHQ